MSDVLSVIKKIFLVLLAAVILLIVGFFVVPSCSWFNKSETEMEETYLRNKLSIERFKKDYFGKEYKLLFLNKNTLSNKEYELYKNIYKINFEELVVAEHTNWLTNQVLFYIVVFKGTEHNANIALKVNKPKYYHFEDYYVLDIYQWHLLFKKDYFSNDFIVAKKGKVLLNVPASALKEGEPLVLPQEIKALTDRVFDKLAVKEIICSSNLVRIGVYSFDSHPYLEKITLNDGLKEIGYEAFYNCKNLKQIVIPLSVEMIDKNAFTSTTVFCEAESKPEGWHENFASGIAKVYYATEWHYDSNGNPVPNNS